MIDDFLHADWDEPPALMDMELSYGEALATAASLAEGLSRAAPPGGPDEWRDAQRLYLLAPAVINVILNYKICVEFGLVLHATEYIDFTRKPGRVVRYLPVTKAEALRLFEEALSQARALVRLEPGAAARAARLARELPPGLAGFVYSSRRDKYTWRGAEPAKVKALGDAVSKGLGRPPALLVGAAHGSIMPGLILAEYLGCPLWFVRFSMFKRRDAEPVVSAVDEERIRQAAALGPVVVFDEDCASGATLKAMAERIGPLAPGLKAAAVIRHASSSFKPDYAGKVWWD